MISIYTVYDSKYSLPLTFAFIPVLAVLALRSRPSNCFTTITRQVIPTTYGSMIPSIPPKCSGFTSLCRVWQYHHSHWYIWNGVKRLQIFVAGESPHQPGCQKTKISSKRRFAIQRRASACLDKFPRARAVSTSASTWFSFSRFQHPQKRKDDVFPQPFLVTLLQGFLWIWPHQGL